MFGFKKSLDGTQRYEIVARVVVAFQAVRDIAGRAAANAEPASAAVSGRHLHHEAEDA
jgi:hypothetical protein